MQKRAFRISGWFMVFLMIALIAVVVYALTGTSYDDPTKATTIIVLVVIFALFVSGLVVISPNDARVIQFFGKYVGTIDRPGFHFTWPLTDKKKISKRIRNFETARLKVSDADGNPVEIAAVVVWRVVDTYAATFGVDDFKDFVEVQSEAAVRHLATSYPYEAHASGRTSLRDSTVVSEELTNELAERASMAGVEVIESRVTHLAYAPEIAHAMLARQQAEAVVAARFKIVEGAIGMVSGALEQLRQQNVVDLDEERKAQMVANLMVVLCGDRSVQPIVNAGSLY